MYAQVIPAKRGPYKLPFFDYKIPEDLEKEIKVGQLVEVPLRSKQEFGVILSITNKEESTLLKQITKIAIPSPVLNQSQLNFLQELSDLYQTSLGFLLKNCLLPLQKRKIAHLGKINKQTNNPPVNSFPKPNAFQYSNKQEKKDYLASLISTPGQIVILVPEITDVKKIIELLPAKSQTIAITSDLSNKELFSAWISIWLGEKKIIVGTRRALFLSFFDLKVIVVDDEGNPNHKSWDMAPRFHARDASLLLAKQHGAKLSFISHTLSVETFYFADKKTYDSPATPPTKMEKKFSLVDMRAERRGGNYSPLSYDLIETLKKTPGSVFLFSHRRGTLGYVVCRDCGTMVKCPTCKQPLSYHDKSLSLECHHCSYKKPMLSVCPKCAGVNIGMYGAGTNYIAKEIKKIMPDDQREIVQIDQDEKNIEQINNQKKQIIIGTQLAWPHILWDNLSIMAFIDADTPLFVPEYKVTENVWQSLRDALYRLSIEVEVFIQTSRPEHLVYQSLINQEQFYTTELANRKMFNYPPFNYLLRVFSSHPLEHTIKQEANQVYNNLKQLTKNSSDIRISEPQAMFPYYFQGKYWQAIIIKLAYTSYKKNIRLILAELPTHWKVDPNPNTVLSH